jgi:hypothetical protein
MIASQYKPTGSDNQSLATHNRRISHNPPHQSNRKPAENPYPNNRSDTSNRYPKLETLFVIAPKLDPQARQHRQKPSVTMHRQRLKQSKVVNNLRFDDIAQSRACQVDCVEPNEQC